MDIQDATTDDLIAALSNRCTAILLLGYEINPLAAGQVNTKTLFKGSPNELAGMALTATDALGPGRRRMFHQLF